MASKMPNIYLHTGQVLCSCSHGDMHCWQKEWPHGSVVTSLEGSTAPAAAMVRDPDGVLAPFLTEAPAAGGLLVEPVTPVIGVDGLEVEVAVAVVAGRSRSMQMWHCLSASCAPALCCRIQGRGGKCGLIHMAWQALMQHHAMARRQHTAKYGQSNCQGMLQALAR